MNFALDLTKYRSPMAITIFVPLFCLFRYAGGNLISIGDGIDHTANWTIRDDSRSVYVFGSLQFMHDGVLESVTFYATATACLDLQLWRPEPSANNERMRLIYRKTLFTNESDPLHYVYLGDPPINVKSGDMIGFQKLNDTFPIPYTTNRHLSVQIWHHVIAPRNDSSAAIPEGDLVTFDDVLLSCRFSVTATFRANNVDVYDTALIGDETNKTTFAESPPDVGVRETLKASYEMPSTGFNFQYYPVMGDPIDGKDEDASSHRFNDYLRKIIQRNSKSYFGDWSKENDITGDDTIGTTTSQGLRNDANISQAGPTTGADLPRESTDSSVDDKVQSNDSNVSNIPADIFKSQDDSLIVTKDQAKEDSKNTTSYTLNDYVNESNLTTEESIDVFNTTSNQDKHVPDELNVNINFDKLNLSPPEELNNANESRQSTPEIKTTPVINNTSFVDISLQNQSKLYSPSTNEKFTSTNGDYMGTKVNSAILNEGTSIPTDHTEVRGSLMTNQNEVTRLLMSNQNENTTIMPNNLSEAPKTWLPDQINQSEHAATPNTTLENAQVEPTSTP